MYDKLAGMTGTALTEAEEFEKTYELDVVPIPTHRPVIRADDNDLIYVNETSKWNAIVGTIKERNERKQPILVGTVAVETSERLSKYLDKAGIKHEVLNAKQHEKEAEIITQAGRPRRRYHRHQYGWPRRRYPARRQSRRLGASSIAPERH